jgi:hypothetical protein
VPEPDEQPAGPWRGVAWRALLSRTEWQFGLALAPGAWPGRAVLLELGRTLPASPSRVSRVLVQHPPGPGHRDDVNLTSPLALHSPVCQLARVHSEASPR